jgi:glyceraldehyde 3-phosphate dehydrogenase
MVTRVAINGFGRIGRNAFRIAFERKDLEIVAINDLTETKTLAYLLKNDTAYGQYKHEVSSDEKNIIVDGKKIPVTAEKDPALLPWLEIGVDVVIESTGRFTKSEDAKAHISAGAKKVVISAPAKDEGAKTVVLGVNESALSNAGDIISNASCTTNSVAAVMDIMERVFGVEKAMLTTVHSYTASQALQDAPAKDLREGRAASENIVPTTTGAATAVALTVPTLKGKFDGLSVRVPTPVVSLSDLTMLLRRNTTIEEINELFKKESKEPYYQGILGISEEPLVSSDYIGNSTSGTVDLVLTNVVDGNLAKVVVWYDNEWGYSNRLVELVADVGKMITEKPDAKLEEEVHIDE